MSKDSILNEMKNVIKAEKAGLMVLTFIMKQMMKIRALVVAAIEWYDRKVK